MYRRRIYRPLHCQRRLEFANDRLKRRCEKSYLMTEKVDTEHLSTHRRRLILGNLRTLQKLYILNFQKSKTVCEITVVTVGIGSFRNYINYVPLHYLHIDFRQTLSSPLPFP